MSAARSALVVALAMLTFGTVGASVADARWFYSKKEAERVARYDAHRRYDDSYGLGNTSARCRPQGNDKADSRYVYHRWVCGWAAYDSDRTLWYGRLLIIGSHDGSWGYYSRKLAGPNQQ